MTTSVRISTAPPTPTTQERWGRSSVPIRSAIDVHLDSILPPHVEAVAPSEPPSVPEQVERTRPAPAPRTTSRGAAATQRVSRVPRWAGFQSGVERVVPTYLAFDSSERLTEYLAARTLLAERTRS